MPELDETQQPLVPKAPEANEEIAGRVSDLKHIASADYKVIYADSAWLTINFYGLSIVFGQIVPAIHRTPGEPTELVVEDRVTVTMSIEHARALADVLQEHIQKYEDKQGPVRRKAK